MIKETDRSWGKEWTNVEERTDDEPMIEPVTVGMWAVCLVLLSVIGWLLCVGAWAVVGAMCGGGL